MLRPASIAAVLALACLLAAGCGPHSTSTQPYTAAGSLDCFAKSTEFKKPTIAKAKLDFIAGFAANGGLRTTTTDGNVLTIAFALDEAGAASTQRAYRRFAPAKLRPRMNDIMEAEGNAVLVWTISPTAEQLATAKSCLHS